MGGRGLKKHDTKITLLRFWTHRKRKVSLCLVCRQIVASKGVHQQAFVLDLAALPVTHLLEIMRLEVSPGQTNLTACARSCLSQIRPDVHAPHRTDR